jgi:hypothetical protein
MVDGREPAASATPAAGALDDAQWTKVFDVDRISQLFLNPQGRPLPSSQLNAEDALRFFGARGGVSRRSASARPGDIFRATTTLRVEGEGDLAPAHFGPMFLGPRDEILFHSVVIDSITSHTDFPVDVQVCAPEGSVAVRLRFVGGWAEGRDSSSLLYTYGAARLYRKVS